MKEFDYSIINKRGLHVRPAADLSYHVKNSNCEVYIIKNDKIVNAERTMDLVGLQIVAGNDIHVIICGEDEEDMYNYLKLYFLKEL